MEAAACGHGGDRGTNPTPKAPAQILLSPPGPDTLGLGETLQLSTTVYAADNSAVTGTRITYASSDSAIASVDSTGTVQAGYTGGVATLTASADSVTSNAVTIIVYDPNVVGVTRTITKVQDVGTPSAGSTVPVAVRITDTYGDPVAGIAVTFSVTAGNGAVVPAGTVTDSTGTFGAAWTIGTHLVPNALVVTAGTLNTQFDCLPTFATPVTAAMQASYTGVAIGTTASFSLWIRDIYGNEGTFPSPSFVSRDTTVLAPQSQSTVGIATFASRTSGQTYVVGSVGGVSDSTLVAVFPANGVLIGAPAPRFALKIDTTFTSTVQLSTGASTPGVGSATITVAWDTTVLTYVSDAQSNTGPSATVNTGNAANGSLTIAVATSTSFNSVPLRDITFTASSTAGRSGAITVTVSDIADNDFNSLLPVTRTLTFPVQTR